MYTYQNNSLACFKAFSGRVQAPVPNADTSHTAEIKIESEVYSSWNVLT